METVDDKPDRDFNGNGGGADDGADSCLCPNLHHYRLANSKSMQTRLLREQGLLRDFAEKAGFIANRAKYFDTRIQCNLCCRVERARSGLLRVRSTSFFFAH